MRRPLAIALTLAWATTGPALGGTFTPAAIAPELGVDVLTRAVARERVGRDVFSNPYATVTISNVDLYDRFPYVESRRFQVVSDPRWNRLVFGEPGRSLRAYDGIGRAFGALSGPRGLSVDERNRLYVADTGNDRVLVLQATSEFDAMDLVPLYAIEGLAAPCDVAYSDGGTPFVVGDDRLYVADTGRNRVVAYAIERTGVRLVTAVGDLGSGVGRFAGPMAIAVGRTERGHTEDVYVADAHNRRIVRLRDEAGGLTWMAEAPDRSDVVTSLDADQWGNLYAAGPREGVIRKFNRSLEPVAELAGQVARPRAFHIPFVSVHDHRDGTDRRVGQASAVSLDDWSDDRGMRMWNLGVGVDGLAVVGGEHPTARFTLTDRATVTLEFRDAADGRVLARRSSGPYDAGVQLMPIAPGDWKGAPASGEVLLRVTAVSSYPGGSSEGAQTMFQVVGGGGVMLPSQPVLLGNWPNPGRPSTRIAFILPQNIGGRATLMLFDAGGRRVRAFSRGLVPGLNEVVWDGADDGGHPARAGLYFYRLQVGAQSFSRRLVVVR